MTSHLHRKASGEGEEVKSQVIDAKCELKAENLKNVLLEALAAREACCQPWFLLVKLSARVSPWPQAPEEAWAAQVLIRLPPCLALCWARGQA